MISNPSLRILKSIILSSISPFLMMGMVLSAFHGKQNFDSREQGEIDRSSVKLFHDSLFLNLVVLYCHHQRALCVFRKRTPI